MHPCLLFLTCKDYKEAEKIANTLLSKKLVSCVKQSSIKSSYLWKNKIEKSKEILLIMDSILEKYNGVNNEVKRMHSYDTYTLFCVKIEKINKKALNWIVESI